jgi:hypothetical protein|tara:strand:- start:5299 stop:6333 length:1035 start_codon:yes stop_codon:yes gene_type:complete
MPDLSRGHTYSSGDEVNHSNLNNLVGNATINDNSITTAKIASGQVTTTEILDGTIATGDIDDDAITYAKIQDTVTDNRVLGAGTAGTVSEVQVNSDMLATDSVATAKVADNAITLAKLEDGTQGDILYYGADGAPARLGFGTSGQVLKTQGTGANPVWATNIPAFAQASLTGTARVYNHSSESVDPVEGTRYDDEAFWLVEDDNSDSMDLSLTVASGSKVKLTIDLETDTNDGNTCVPVRVQRTVDSGTTWTDLPRGDAAATRVRVAFTTQHGSGHRNNGRSTWHYIDTPASTSVRYRVIYSPYPGNYLYLNREYSVDSDGDSGGTSTGEYRSTSYFLLEEIQQ